MSSSLRPTRGSLVAAAAAAVVSLLTSPILVVWSLAVGGATALLGSLLVRWVPHARMAAFVGLGLVVGAVPYLVLAVVSGLGDAPSSTSG